MPPNVHQQLERNDSKQSANFGEGVNNADIRRSSDTSGGDPALAAAGSCGELVAQRLGKGEVALADEQDAVVGGVGGEQPVAGGRSGAGGAGAAGSRGRHTLRSGFRSM